MNRNLFSYSEGRSRFLPALLCLGLYMGTIGTVMADEPGPGMVYPPKRGVVAPAAPVVAREEPVQTAPEIIDSDCDWGFRLAAGVPVWFFDEESELPGAGLYADLFNNGRRVNFRIGVEGRHMYLGQEEAESASEFPGKTPRITYMRIPLSAEYIVALDGDGTQLFLGGGPDIVHTANDIESTEVGAHLSARVLHNFDENWGIALEGGYMWGSADMPGDDVNLDGAYVTPTLNYTF